MKSCKKKKGITVIELAIVMTLMVIVLGIIWTMFNISSRINSDVNIKSDLQKERQAIQEKISNIGMQAIGIQSIDGDSTSGEIRKIVIHSYDKDGNTKDFEIKSNGGVLTIDGQNFSSNIKSIKVDPGIINNGNLNNITYIDFTIILSKKKNYNGDTIDKTIKVKTVFRNKYTLGT